MTTTKPKRLYVVELCWTTAQSNEYHVYRRKRDALAFCSSLIKRLVTEGYEKSGSIQRENKTTLWTNTPFVRLDIWLEPITDGVTIEKWLPPFFTGEIK